ncbi:MAG TPA: septal ring lytic transglycosylase RlpA family protein [Candidatus Angelobacter sp.]|nr:septal ring lytic transglycosylase RlpA family protein [Candidatus Angelobacter sp.]
MNRVLSILMVAVFLASSVGAAPVPNHPVPQVSKKASRPYQVGNASWYGKKFHGRTTASGEDFDMFELTAAHRQLPLGTYVRVTDLRNGKWVIVRINDRGPYIHGRIMDLSYGAARMLDFHAGVEKVRLDIVAPETVASNQSLTE